MKNLKLLFVFLCLTTYSLSQDYINSYDWETPAKLWTVSQSQKNEDEIQLLKKEICQYVYENNSLVEYDLFHIRYYLGNKTGIIKNNKVYIPINGNEQLIKTKARVILPGGKIITFDKEDMKEGYEDNVKYNFFALNGLVPGCEVEYIYVIKTAPNLMGITYTFQEEDTTYRQSLELISPPNIVLISKSYNGLAEMQKDTSLAPRNFLKLELDTVPGLADEPSAFMDKYYQKVEYKMDRNTITGKRNIVDYGKIARTLQQNANPELTKDDKKALNAIFKAAQLNNKDSAINNIEALENYLKTNFVFKTESNPELFSITAIYKNKAYSELGAIRIYTGICNMLNIKIQPVLTCDRTETNFDKKFASYNYLQKGLLYFPEIDAYLDPTESSSRLGLIDAEYTGIVGLHVKTVSMGDYKTGLAVFKVIPPSSAETNLTDMNIHVTFGDNFDNFSMHYLTKRYGLINNIIQNYYDKMDDEQKKKFEDNVLKYYDNYQVNNLKIANASPTDIAKKPLIVEGDITADDIVLSAGEKVLFKIGKLIGPQEEMYAKKKIVRLLPIENYLERSYHRDIYFDIPKGYKIENPEILNKNLVFKDNNGKVVVQFVSAYTLENGKLKVTIDESYHKLKYPKDMTENYIKVVNAAADFNKLVLVFKKSS